jgi:hypothetical protein
MATGLHASAANTFLDAHAAAFPWIKFHIGDPGAAGTANAAAETDRVQASWAVASGGSIATNAELRLNGVAAAEDFTHWTGWSAQTNGTVGWSGTVTADPLAAGNNFVIPSGGLTYTLNVMA